MASATLAPSEPASAPPQAEQVHTSLEVLNDLYNINHYLFNAMRPFIRGSVFEVGCGIGNTTQFLLNQPRVVGIEPFVESYRIARVRFAPHLNVQIHPFFLHECPNRSIPAGAFDTVISLNVIEHIEDDVDALDRCRQLCAPGGRVVTVVPAHMWLYGSIDRSFGHFRRYSKRTLGNAYRAAGLRVERCFHKNFISPIVWLWYGRLRRLQQMPRAGAKRFDQIVPLVDAVERIIPPPFGQTLVMVGTPIDKR